MQSSTKRVSTLARTRIMTSAPNHPLKCFKDPKAVLRIHPTLHSNRCFQHGYKIQTGRWKLSGKWWFRKTLPLRFLSKSRCPRGTRDVRVLPFLPKQDFCGPWIAVERSRRSSHQEHNNEKYKGRSGEMLRGQNTCYASLWM